MSTDPSGETMRRTPEAMPAAETATPAPLGRHDPDTYAYCSAPYATADEADTALAAFHTAVRALRKTHRIAEVAVVAMTHVATESQVEGRVASQFHGDSVYHSRLLAFALGRAEATDAAIRAAHIDALRAKGRQASATPTSDSETSV